MRALTEQEIAVITGPDAYTVRARVWLWDGAAFQDLSTLVGRDWLVEVAWDESVNDPTAQATVTLRRRLEDYSLNPLVSNALTGVLALGRAFYIETATIPLEDSPTAGDWVEVFRGQVEEMALDKDPMTFTGRDGAGVLLRTFIETEREYGSDAGVLVQTVMQSILSDNGTGMTLYAPTSPGVLLSKFKQKKAAVLEAVRERALAIGWDARMWWDEATSAFRFTLLQVDRNASVSRWTFQPWHVKAVTKMSQSMMDVRNAGALFYYNRSALDAGNKPTYASVTASDATSIAKYGRLYFQLAEDENSPIDSPGEAQAMLNAAIADLKEPLLDFSAEVGFHYGVQLGDMLTFAADGDNFSSDQTLAVVGFSHSIGAKGHKTALTLRGKPVGAQDHWLRRESRVVRQPRAAAPDTVLGLTATATTGGVVVTFSAPTAPPLPAEYELHLSTVSGFTPSASTLRERANRTRFEVTGLTPGTTYYIKVVPRDVHGNRAAASAEVTVSPRYVEPRILQPRITPGALFNGDFEAINDPSSGPDAWTTTGGTWGSSITSTTDAYAGTSAVVFASGATPSLTSQPFTVRAGEQWVFSAWYKQSTAGVRTGSLVVAWLQSLASTLTTSVVAIGTTATVANSWTRAYVTALVPTGARYAVVSFVRDYSTTGTLTIDSADAYKVPGFESWLTPTLQNGWAAANAAIYGNVQYRKNDLGEVQFRGVAGAPSPAPSANSVLFTLPSGYRPLNGSRLWRTSTGSASVDLLINTSGTVFVASIPAGASVPLDGFSFQAEQ